jgi:hypothetical protein
MLRLANPSLYFSSEAARTAFPCQAEGLTLSDASSSSGRPGLRLERGIFATRGLHRGKRRASMSRKAGTLSLLTLAAAAVCSLATFAAAAITPVISSIPSQILVGDSFTISGSGFTAGSRVNFFVAMATGPVNFGPLKPSAQTSTTLTVPVPTSVPLGDGVATVVVVDTDQGPPPTQSNPKTTQLFGDPAKGFPNLTAINGVPLAATSTDPSFAVDNVETVVKQGTTVTLDGNGFDTVNGVAVDLFCACPGGKIPTILLKPGNPGLSATVIKITLPPSGPSSPATGPGSFVVSNKGATGTFNSKSNAVSVPIGALITVTNVSQAGCTVTVKGTGFSSRTVINLFNKQCGGVLNLGGLNPGGTAKIKLTILSSTLFTFGAAGIAAGPAYVQALNPPFVPFASSGTGPGGSFTAASCGGAAMLVGDSNNDRVLEFRPPFTTDMNASAVIGQPNFTSSGNATARNRLFFESEAGVGVDAAGNLYVGDSLNNRVLQFLLPFCNGLDASVVFGQSNFTSSAAVTSANGLSQPIGTAFDPSGNLWVADLSNNRVLEYKPPFSNGVSASLVLGQSSFTASGSGVSKTQLNGPFYVAFGFAGDLYVSDEGNNRVLIFRPPFSIGMAASVVVGQKDFVSKNAPSPPTASSLASPLAVAGDKAGNLYVADLNNSRVLQFRPPFSNGMSASLVLGQKDFVSSARVATQSGMEDPAGVTVDSNGNVFVADQDANRVTEYSPPLSNGMKAAIVIGQPNFTSSSSGTSQNTLNSPQGIALDP